MKRFVMLVATCSAICAAGGTSSAAAYDAPSKASQLEYSLVTAYDGCTAPTLSHNPLQPSPACPAQRSPGKLMFLPDQNAGASSMRLTLKALGSGDIRVDLRGYSVQDDRSANNLPPHPFSGDTYGVIRIRMTDTGCRNTQPPYAYERDCTVVDVPFPLAFRCTYGLCRTLVEAASMNRVLPELLHRGDRAVLAISEVQIYDNRDDTLFAVPGLVANGGALNGFSAPSRADSQARAFVPVFERCTAPTATHRPNLDRPACAPQQSTATDFTLGPAGRISAEFKLKGESVLVKLKGADVRRNGSAYTGSELKLRTGVRTTDTDCGPEPYTTLCTQVDTTHDARLDCVSGRCAVNPNDRFWDLRARGEKTLVQFRDEAIVDGDGDQVAVPGLYVK